MTSKKKWLIYNLASVALGAATIIYSLLNLASFRTVQWTEGLAMLIASALGLYFSISAFINLRWLGRTFSIISTVLLTIGAVFPIWSFYMLQDIQMNGVFCKPCTQDSGNRSGDWEYRKDGKIIWSQYLEDSGGSYYPKDSNNALMAAKKGGKWGFINLNGESVSPFKFDRIELYAQSESDLIPVKLEESWGLANIKGDIVVLPRYKKMGRYNKKMIAVEYADSLWGYIDMRGNEVVKATYAQAGDIVDVAMESSGIAVVKDGDKKCAYINSNGKIISDFFQNCTTPIKGDAEQKIGIQDSNSGKYGYININGEIAIKAQYKTAKDEIISSSRQNLRPIVACVATDERFGVINIRGELISNEINEECDTVMKDDERVAALLKRNGRNFTLFIDGSESSE